MEQQQVETVTHNDIGFASLPRIKHFWDSEEFDIEGFIFDQTQIGRYRRLKPESKQIAYNAMCRRWQRLKDGHVVLEPALRINIAFEIINDAITGIDAELATTHDFAVQNLKQAEKSLKDATDNYNQVINARYKQATKTIEEAARRLKFAQAHLEQAKEHLRLAPTFEIQR